MTDTQWVQVAKSAAIEAGGMMAVELGTLQIAIYNVGGTLYATDNICSHAFAMLTDGSLDGDIVKCPLHGGCFNVRTGAGQGKPISRDIKSYKVRVTDGCVEVAIPQTQ